MKRKTGKVRKVAKRILILVEGETEYLYTQELKQNLLSRDKQRSISIEIEKPNNENQPQQLLTKANEKFNKSKKDKNPYQYVWIVIDRDNRKEQEIKIFFEQLNKQNKVQVAYSCV